MSDIATQRGPTTGSSGRGAPLLFIAATGAALAATAVVAVRDPNVSGHYPTCPLLAMTGLWCPGCGTMRAVHALTHLDLGGALALNPLMVLMIPALVLLWVGWGLRAFGSPRGDRLSATRIRPVWLWVLLAVVVLYGVARNVPGWTLLSPA